MTVHDASWHERRRLSGGASDLPTILGCSPYADADPLVLAWQKRGVIPPTLDAPSMDDWIALEFEAMGRRWLAKELGATVSYEPDRDDFQVYCCSCKSWCRLLSATGNETQESTPLPCCGLCEDGTASHIHANLDGQVTYEGRCLVYEHKAIRFGNPEYDRWRHNGVPDSVEWQVQQQMLCSHKDAALVVVFDVPNAEFSVRIVEANEQRQDFLIDAWNKWWQAAVVGERDPSTEWTSALERAMRARWPERKPAMIALPATLQDVAEEWVCSKDLARRYAKDAKSLRTRLLYAMEDNAVGYFPDESELHRKVSSNGRITLTYKKGPQ